MATARGKQRGLSRQGDVTTVKVAVDTARKKRFDVLLAAMNTSRRDEAGGFDAYWEAVGDILGSELYVAGGHATAAAFVRAVVKVPLRSALRNVRVARHASPAEEARYGTAVLDAALAYIEAKAGGPIEGKLPVAFDKLRVPVARGEGTGSILLAEATVDQVRAATRALLGGGKRASASTSPVEQAIGRAFRGTKALHGITVRVRGGRVQLGAFPATALGELGRALAGVKLPAAEKAGAAAKEPAKKARPAKGG
jgi:hypothetical protein